MKLTVSVPRFRLRQLSLITPVTLLLLSACANFGQQPDLQTPQEATQLQLPAGQSAHTGQNWWLGLNQPLLNKLMDTGLANAPDLRIAAARIAQAEAQWRGARGEAGVQVGIQANGVAAYLNPKPDSNRAGDDPNHVFRNEMAAVAVNYTFDFWGKQRNLIKAALGARLAAAYQQEQARLVLSQSIVSQYTQWQLLQEQVNILQQRIGVNQQLQKLVANRIHAGLQPASDEYTFTQTVLGLQSALRQTQADIERTRHSMAVLVGLSPNQLPAMVPQPLGKVPEVAVDGLRADILGQRPDIAAQRALLQSNYFGIKAAEAAFYPDIEIKGLAGLAHVDAFDLVHSSSRMLGIVPAISLPIFTSGSLQAALSGKRSAYNEQVAQYDKTVLTALQQAADAMSDYQHSTVALPLQQQAFQVAQKNAVSSSKRHAAGLDNAITKLQREDTALRARADWVKTIAWQQQSWNSLHAALGGGFQLSDTQATR
ncbi:efflux transporter outer membrane subunit [Snodgrassella alvi]|uniref:efflux transporter outer membrane subunit n=1 Tax=Snodgrassella alvi TaxID=1196083 RepID=UPI000C1ED53D|nr:efflux transporter outer membrane subunit [Snodgrassella alvi]